MQREGMWMVCGSIRKGTRSGCRWYTTPDRVDRMVKHFEQCPGHLAGGVPAEVWAELPAELREQTPEDARPRLPGPGTAGAVAHARRADPATSHEAAASLSSAHLRASQAALLRMIRQHDDGVTDPALAEEVRAARASAEVWASDPALTWASALPASPSGVRSRRAELVAQGLVRDTGERTKTPSGRRQIVWAAVE